MWLAKKIGGLDIVEHPPTQKIARVHSKNEDNRIKAIIDLAKHYSWSFDDIHRGHKWLKFKKEDTYVEVWYTKMTVATTMTHPTKGRSKLIRRKVSPVMLSEIFRNPRVHTSKKYIQSWENQNGGVFR